MIELARHDRGVILPVRAQPNARKEGILGERAGALRVSVTAAPEQGKANASIARVLAKGLALKHSEVALLAGATSRDKKFLILGLYPDDLRARLDRALAAVVAG